MRFRELTPKYDAQVIGKLEDYPIVFDVCSQKRELSEEWAETRELPPNDQILGDVECGSFTEVVNLEALKARAQQQVDRRQSALCEYIAKIERDGVRDEEWPGMICHEVKYYRKHGVGRRYAIGWSLQHMTEESRDWAVMVPMWYRSTWMLRTLSQAWVSC